MRAAIVTVGDEILYGQIIDTNSQYIADKLTQLGITIMLKVSIGDTRAAILEALKSYTPAFDLVLFTGGLGPTQDDLTKEVITTFLNDTLVCHEPTLELIKVFFQKRNRPLLEANVQQAYVPSTCNVLLNTCGTAPGMWFDLEGEKTLVALPGVPYEMQYLMDAEVLPRLQRKYTLPVIMHRMVYTAGIGESFLAEKIKHWENSLPEHLKLAYLPSLGMVKLRLTAKGSDRKILENELAEQTNVLRSLISEYIFSIDFPDSLEKAVVAVCKEKGKTLAVAESCTGGEIGQLLTKIPGVSDVFKGGIVAYANTLKTNVLGVEAEVLETHGAVSEQVAAQMAAGAARVCHADVAVSTTGIAGPQGDTSEKPVGTVCLGVYVSGLQFTKTVFFQGSRQNIIRLSAVAALHFLFKTLQENSN